MLDGPQVRGQAVLRGGGCLVLGSQPIVHGQHRDTGIPTGLAARLVMGLQVTDHPAAAVEEHQQGPGVIMYRLVVPDPDGAGRPGDGEVAHLPHRRAELQQPRLPAHIGPVLGNILSARYLPLPHQLHTAQQ
ncbi:Uncharacterised protein [Mycobacteroides abscessus subsp. abscessus]|nr:Uncharacterised protein [Mycobacteroides abscessus subsp. abscessus]